MLQLTGLVLAALMVVGQPNDEKMAIPSEVAEELEFFVGAWTVNGTIDAEPLTGHWFATLAPGQHSVKLDYAGSVGSRTFQGSGLIGWDSVTKEYVTVGFFSSDAFEDVRYKKDESGKFSGTYKASVRGETTSAKCTLEKGSDKWTFSTRKGGDDGEMKRVLSVTFTRAEDNADKAKKWMEFLVGRWVNENGDQTGNWKMSPNGAALTSADDEVTIVVGRDASQNKLVFTAHFTNGMHYRAEVQEVGDEWLKGTATGVGTSNLWGMRRVSDDTHEFYLNDFETPVFTSTRE